LLHTAVEKTVSPRPPVVCIPPLLVAQLSSPIKRSMSSPRMAQLSEDEEVRAVAEREGVV
jgi:hypothetical protein